MITRRSALAQMSSMALLALLPRDVQRGQGFPHPDPRPGITSESVLPESKLPDKAAVRRAYQAARDYPAIFDGLYCPCDCSKALKHRSLLSCYETDQPTGCWSCREAGEYVGTLAKEGKSLEEIRAAVDKKFD